MREFLLIDQRNALSHSKQMITAKRRMGLTMRKKKTINNFIILITSPSLPCD